MKRMYGRLTFGENLSLTFLLLRYIIHTAAKTRRPNRTRGFIQIRVQQRFSFHLAMKRHECLRSTTCARSRERTLKALLLRVLATKPTNDTRPIQVSAPLRLINPNSLVIILNTRCKISTKLLHCTLSNGFDKFYKWVFSCQHVGTTSVAKRGLPPNKFD